MVARAGGGIHSSIDTLCRAVSRPRRLVLPSEYAMHIQRTNQSSRKDRILKLFSYLRQMLISVHKFQTESLVTAKSNHTHT